MSRSGRKDFPADTARRTGKLLFIALPSDGLLQKLKHAPILCGLMIEIDRSENVPRQV
jgi:hypothetical protein